MEAHYTKRRAQGQDPFEYCFACSRSATSLPTRNVLAEAAGKRASVTLTDLGGALAGLPGLPEIAQPAVAAAGKTTSSLCPHLRPQFWCISSGHSALSCTTDPMETDVVDVAENGKNPNVSGFLGECKNGSGGRDRTADKRIMIPLLYQLSYAANE